MTQRWEKSRSEHHLPRYWWSHDEGPTPLPIDAVGARRIGGGLKVGEWEPRSGRFTGQISFQLKLMLFLVFLGDELNENR